jgi:hypothetical protein
MALGTLYCPLSPLPPFSTLLPTSDNHDNCNNRSCDKREIAIIDLTLQRRAPNVSPIGLKFQLTSFFYFKNIIFHALIFISHCKKATSDFVLLIFENYDSAQFKSMSQK